MNSFMLYDENYFFRRFLSVGGNVSKGRQNQFSKFRSVGK